MNNEFKGTKGKWEVLSSEEYSDTLYIKNEHGAPSFKENEANAILISKSPEMLDMLKFILPTFNGTKTGEYIKQLIHEATNI